MDRKHNCGIYEYVQGETIPMNKVGAAEIDRAANFLFSINECKPAARLVSVPMASEACFSLEEIFENISTRFERLKKTEGDHQEALRDFLFNHFIPAFNHFKQRAKSAYQEFEIRTYSKLPEDKRVLSPSDFGFHNSLRREDGTYCFLDFEYFGWDDPAKTISDFLMHPSMNLNAELGNRFMEKVISKFSSDTQLRHRFNAVFPLFGLKWCLILLNEFIRDEMERRFFAADMALHRSDILAEQLYASNEMLKKLRSEYEKREQMRSH